MLRKNSRKGYKANGNKTLLPKNFWNKKKLVRTHRLHPKMMKCGYFASKDGDSEECKIIFKVEVSATEWAFEGVREAFEKVAKR